MSKMKFRNNIFAVAVTVLLTITLALICIIIKEAFNYYVENVNMYHSMVDNSFEDMRKNLAVNALQIIEEKEIWNVLKSQKVDIEEELYVRNMLNEKYGCEVLWVNADNKRAIHTYEKNGYVVAEPTMYLMKKAGVK